MWSVMTRIGSVEPKFGSLHKGGYHTSINPLLPPCLNPIPNKEFSYCKQNVSLGVQKNYQNSSTSMKMDLEINSSRPTPEEYKSEAGSLNSDSSKQHYTCNNNSKKKRKKKRRRRKKNKNQAKIVNCFPSKQQPVARERTISTAESEDSFVIYFDDEHEDVFELSDVETATTENFSESSESIIPHKRVRFMSDSKLCEVHSMIVWSYAYQAARKGPWEEYARDRARFHMRVANTEALIGHVFTADHRSRVYEQRFSSHVTL